MAEEREEEEEEASSPEPDGCLGAPHSSTEDLLSIDSALQGSEYYKDLGLGGPLEPTLAKQPEWPPPRSSAESRGGFQEAVGGHYLDTACACSCSSGSQGGFMALEAGALEVAFPVLVRSMSTSRRYSWGSPLSPAEAQQRLSFSASDPGSDAEKEDSRDQSSLGLPPPLPLPQTGLATGEGTVIQVQIKPLGLDLVCDPDDGESGSPGKGLRSRSVPSPADSVASPRMSRSPEVSLPDTVGIVSPGLEMVEKEHIPPEQVLMVQQVLKELEQYHSAKQGSCAPEDSAEAQQNLTWFEFLAHESEESRKSDKAEPGSIKVKRRLSNLRSRVTSSKEKGKNKDQEKEATEAAQEQRQAVQGHALVRGAFSGHTCCSLCGKALLNNTGLQCLHCAVNVHKNCKELLPECPGAQLKPKEPPSRPPGGAPDSSLQSSCAASALKEPPPRSALLGPDGTPGPPRHPPGMTIVQRGSSPPPLSTSAGAVGQLRLLSGEMDEADAGLKPASEDVLVPAASEPVFVEDAHLAALQNELEADAREFEAESWSLAVDPLYAKKQKNVLKRQDVIYELMQTEMHHVRTLKIMLKVYSRAMREELQFGNAVVHRLFSGADKLLELHAAFLLRLKERRREALEEGSERNYVIRSIGDLLVQQFSGEPGQRMTEQYGLFCSRSTEASGHYKALMQHSKRFQALIRKISQSSIVRRLGVQECNLLVTQRITKYPILLERLIQNTEAGTKEYEDLSQALSLIKEVLTAVDAKVNECGKGQRLREIVARMELKSLGKFKNGLVFRKEDMLQRRLLVDGMLHWKAASGRLKEVLAVLLTDVLLLLQEKDQKYTFASVDAKPPVISLQKLIVREVANEERAMFLISASLKGPEMYEIHTNSKEDRNTWMALIRQAVESCPDEEAGAFGDPKEERRQVEVRAAKLKEFQDRLSAKDALIVQSLNEKQQIYQEMVELSSCEDLRPPRLICRAESPENLQGEALLRRAVMEAESLQTLLLGQLGSVASRPEDAGGSGQLRRAETFGGYDRAAVADPARTGSFQKKVCRGEPGGPEGQAPPSAKLEAPLQEPPSALKAGLHMGDNARLEISSSSSSSSSFFQPPLETESEIVRRIQMLLQLLLSLQAVLAQQDSYVEVQRSALLLQSTRGGLLLEQERQRNFEKQREEQASVQRLQSQLKAEQQRWGRERERQRRELEAAEARLREREEEGRQLEARLGQEREELERQREAYQHDLERLREAQRAVEKERERLEQLRKLKKPPPAATATATATATSREMMMTMTGHAHTVLSHSASFNGEGLELGGALATPRARGSVSRRDSPERAELARRDSAASEGRPLLALKSEVPIHLLSATNQIQKQAAVQQQIPTKLAAFTKGGKEKGGKAPKASHRADSAALSSVDLRQLLPPRMASKEELAPWPRRSTSPVFLPSQSAACLPGELPDPAESQPEGLLPASANLFKPNSVSALPPASDDTSEEDVIFF